MNIRQAIEDTLRFARQVSHNNPDKATLDNGLDLNHLEEMYQTVDMDQSMSDTKLCRWLGWMQAAIVSWGTATLDDMKNINKRNAS